MKYKWIGAIIGFIIVNFIGAIIGYYIGAAIDGAKAGSPAMDYSESYASGSQQRQYDSFLYCLMYLSADVIFADGRIYQAEIDVLRNFLNQALGPQAAQRGMQFFEQLRAERRQKGIAAWNASVQKVCRDLGKVMPEGDRIQLVAFLAEIAKSDGNCGEPELRALRNIAFYMGLDTDVVDQMMSLGGQSLDDAYKVLGLTPSATDDEVRKAYKKMVLQHHPDRVAHLGEEVKNAATKKMQEINKAKDAIYSARGMK
ncbi:MAG: TerB family tellurite resistance protein [Bacteroidales bacterium]|nr:TerB family tellurite resistance protein [Bacteroidales bacterium]